MVFKNGKAPARRKSASSSTRSNRSNSVPKSSPVSNLTAATDKLDGFVDHDESPALQGETGYSILEKTGTSEGTSGYDLPSGTTELTAITLHQPWASLIAVGKKHYETRSWKTDYRGPIAIHAGKKFEQDESLISLLGIPAAEVPLGAVVAIADLTDCIEMTSWFIAKVSMTEKALGDFRKGRFAWKLENVRAIEPIPATGKQGLWKWECQQSTINNQLEPWNPADFGELHHVAEADGQLNLLEWTDKEPPEPDDYASIELFDEAYKQWEIAQQSTVNSQQSTVNSQEVTECSTLMDGSTFAAESVPASPMQESNCGEEALTSSANGMDTANQSSDEDSPTANDLAISKSLILGQANSEVKELALPQQARHANHLATMETDSLPETIETASPQSLPPSTNCSLTLQLLKMLPDFSNVQSDQEATNFISLESLTNFPRAGTMSNGRLSVAPTLPALGVGKESLLLRSPGALSATKGRPPGKTRLESQLHQLGLIQDGEVVNPEFLEAGYNLPIGWTNLQENRTAIELAQVQAQQSSINHKSELLPATETTATDEKLSATPLTGELLLLDSSELSISLTLPPNIGALTKNELISMAQEQHQLICVIERKEFELAIEKLHRVRLTGVYLQEFKKKCQYGEFENQLEQSGIGIRSAQNYMAIAKNWEIVEAKTKLVALLAEENQPAIGLKWALEAVRDEKKQLKSAAPPKDPDSWKTPNTKDQPVVALVQQALGGQIWLDPCSSSVTNHLPCAVRYYKDDNGLSPYQGWNKTVFVNPPFSDPFPWVERCCLEFARGNVSAAVMLLKAGTLSNVGTGELINKYASAVCHWRGRINFLNDEGNAVKGSDFDCVFIYFGARLDLFRQAFSGRGTIAIIDNHYSSVNKKFLDTSAPEQSQTLKSEEKQLAAAVGLSNGRSVLPDRRDFDRELAERYDPHTVVDVLSMPTPATPVSENLSHPISKPEIFDETPLLEKQFEEAKDNCLNDYITAISSNISAFSDEQIAFLAKIINEESAKRIGF